jgi:hypothetical protein
MHRRDLLAAGAAAVLGAGVAGAADPGSTARPFRPSGFAAVEGAKEGVVGPDGHAYLATTDGFAVVDVAPPGGPAVLAERRGLLADREGGPLGGVWDVAVDGDRLLVVGPAHGDAALAGAAVVDVSDPAAPSLAWFHSTAFPIHNAALDAGVAYLTGNDGADNPLVTVDIERRAELGRWSLPAHAEGWRAVHPARRTLHDVTVRDGRAYLAHWDAGTWILDVSDPGTPVAIGSTLARSPATLADGSRTEAIELPGNDHYAAVDESGTVLAVGREAWDADRGDGHDGGPGGVELYDLSALDTEGPRSVAHVEAPPTPDPTYAGTWTTAHNLDIAGGRLYTAWYRGGVKIHDVSDPAEPRELSWWRRPAETAFWTARHAGDRVVATSFRGETGLFVFPDRAGEQPDPPSLATTRTEGSEANTTVSSTATGTPETTTRTGRQPAPTTGRSGGWSRDGHGHSHGSWGTATESPGVPGFGVHTGVVGLGLAAWRRWRR